VNATEVTAGLAENNGSLLLGLWRDSLHVTCGLTACTPGSAPGPTLGNEYGKTLPFTLNNKYILHHFDNEAANINSKNSSLSIMLTAGIKNRKKKSLKRSYYSECR